MSKVIAVMEEPMGCTFCPFSVCKWSNPWWSKEKANTTGHYCRLVDKANRETFVFDCGDLFYKWDKCPLKPLKEADNE